MIYYTGDIHGDVLHIRDMVTKHEITDQDVIVILGDVGMNYYGNNHGDQHRKKKLNKLGVPVFCIHGNHEMRPETIPTYHEEKWKGGTVYVEDAYPNLLFAKDSEVYDLDGQSALVIGGAYSVDKWYRLRMDMNWFADEQPSDEIKSRVMNETLIANWNRKVHGNDTVYILGDMFFRTADPEPILRQLKGKKHLITGNHDSQWMKKVDLNRWFVSVQPYLETSDGQHTLTMCHFPMVCWNHQSRSYMIHGHIHENTDMDYWPLLVARERVLNAGCDINNFEPVSFKELVENNAKFKATVGR